MGKSCEFFVLSICFTLGIFLDLVLIINASPTPLSHEESRFKSLKIKPVFKTKRDANFEDPSETNHKSPSEGLSHILMNLSTEDADYHRKLFKPENPIFTSEFKFHIAEEDPTEDYKFTDATPSAENIAKITNGHFVNADIGAAVSISNILGDGVSENPKVHGIFGNVSILRRENDSYKIIKRNSKENEVLSDYIDLHRNVTPGQATKSIVSSQPEVYVVFDYDNYQTFNGNTEAIIDYIGVFFNGINNRYATISDPKITFRISGITAVSSPGAQPYIETTKTPEKVDKKGNDITKLLESFSKWIYSNSNSIPKHDIAIILSGRDFYGYYPSTKTYDISSTGMAYIKGACWTSRRTRQFVGSGIGEDMGGYYDGVYTMAHELAHVLGAPHDGILGASSCSWSDGYIMSYLGWGTSKKFQFSPCSIKIMKDFILSSGGSCLRTIQNPNQIALPKDQIGDRLTMKQRCISFAEQWRHYGEMSDVDVDYSFSPSDLCKLVQCQWVRHLPGNRTFVMKMPAYYPAGDNTPCGNEGGRCREGECVLVDEPTVD